LQPIATKFFFMARTKQNSRRQLRRERHLPVASKLNRKVAELRARAAAGEISLHEACSTDAAPVRSKRTTNADCTADSNTAATTSSSSNSASEQHADDNSPGSDIVSVPYSCCSDDVESETIICVDCRKSLHSDCIGLGIIDVLKIDFYICKACENYERGRFSHWKQNIPDSEKQLEKDRDYFEVEKITGNKILEDGKRIFKIRWKGTVLEF